MPADLATDDLLRLAVVACAIAAGVLGAVIWKLERLVRDGCDRCTHCQAEKLERYKREDDRRTREAHQAGFHAPNCQCQKGGPRTPRA